MEALPTLQPEGALFPALFPVVTGTRIGDAGMAHRIRVFGRHRDETDCFASALAHTQPFHELHRRYHVA